MAWLSKIPAAIAYGAAIAASASAFASVYSASTAVDISSEASSAPFTVFLPQYSGPGVITEVILSISGSAGGVNWYPYDPAVGITVPASSASWDVLLFSADSSLVADASANATIPGVSIPGCGYEGCGPTPSYAYATPAPAMVSADGMALDLADFGGTGSVNLTVIDTSSFSNNTFTGTVSEAIYTSVIEPSTWILLLTGVGTAGGALRSRRSLASERLR